MKQRKIYRILGIVSAIEFLRPGAKYALMDNKLEWFDSRPAPSAKEINETLQKIKDFEDLKDVNQQLDTMYVVYVVYISIYLIQVYHVIM